MDESHKPNLEEYEALFSQQVAKPSSSIYNYHTTKNTKECPYTAKEVIENVKRSLRAIQNADYVITDRNVKKRLQPYKQSSLLPLNLLSVPREEPPATVNANKFETQCVTDTQLIDVVDNAEALLQVDINKEFETTFCSEEGQSDKTGLLNVEISPIRYNNDENPAKRPVAENVFNRNNSDGNGETKIYEVKIQNAIEDNDIVLNASLVLPTKTRSARSKNLDIDMKTDTHEENIVTTQLLNESMEIEKNNESLGVLLERETNRPLSPVLNLNTHKRKAFQQTSQHLVFSLEKFENFEMLAKQFLACENDPESESPMLNENSPILSIRIPSELDTVNDFGSPLRPIVNKQEENCEYESETVVNDESTVIKLSPKTEGETSNEPKSATPNVQYYEILDDEILFSSDEETDYVHKSNLEVPLTCALETSFYTENSDILDKTMFVGFQTASNKSIQICTDSFGKAQNILSEVENKRSKTPVSLTELVAQCDGLVSGRKPDNKPSPPTHDEIVTNEESKTIIVPKSDVSEGSSYQAQEEKEFFNTIGSSNEKASKEPLKFEGFKTASNKNICVFEKSLSVVKSVFQDIDMVNLNINPHSPAILDTKSANNTTINDENDYEMILNEFKNDIMPEEHISKNSENSKSPAKHENIEDDQACFFGFKTASNKDIKISDKALAKTKNIFEDIDIDKDICTTETYALETKRVTKSHHKLENNNSASNNEDSFIGFQTASSKPIKISDKAMAKTKQIFQDIDTDIIKEVDTNSVGSESRIATQNTASDNCNQGDRNESIGFKTASFKRITVSEAALAKSMKIFQEANETEPFAHKSKTEEFVGFQTASNKKLVISEKYLARTRSVFKDIDLNENFHKENIITTDIIQCQNDKKNSSDKVTSTYKKLCENTDSYQSSTNEGFVGFQKASNKKIEVSNKAMAKCKEVFQDINTDYSLENNLPDHNRVSMVHTSKSQNINRDCGFVGFTTASNKKVSVSKEAIAKTKNVFQNINIDDVTLTENNVKNDLSGFQTLSDKKIHISAKALQKRKFCQETHNDDSIDKQCITDGTIQPFVGFQTASNKKVTVSKDALTNSRKIFDDFDTVEKEFNPIEQNKNNFMGFQTASNKRVKVSEEALKTTKNLFEDICPSQIENIFLENENEVDTLKPKFTGFQTASNKKVTISEEALKKTKCAFQDIELSQIEDACLEKQSVVEKINTEFTGFQTASNKKVTISEEALKKTKSIFQDISLSQMGNLETAIDKKVCNNKDSLANKSILNNANCDQAKEYGRNAFLGFHTANKKEVKISESALAETRHVFKENNKERCLKETDPEIDKYLNTQVLNNFEEPLNTEDFIKTPKKPKRSASPILSCPKAKKRKIFQTPYKAKDAAKNDTPKIIPEAETITGKVLSFNKSYKSNKILKLKDIQLLENSSSDVVTIDPYIATFDFDNLLKFEFYGERNTISDSKLTTEDLKLQFLQSVNKKIVPDGWLDNHIRLIIWKLIRYELLFPKSMVNACNTTNVIDQLKYRYDKELYNVERPVLRKILEKDEVASRTMVLCVAAVYADGISVIRVPEQTSSLELLLTDGWYAIRATPDLMLTRLARAGRLGVGMKIAVCGAELDNCSQPVCAWEDTSKVRLKLHGNSTRPAHWDARLGCHGNAAMLSRLAGVGGGGGGVRARARVTRVYPALHVRRRKDGTTLTLSDRLEQIYQHKHEAERQALMEKIYEEVEREMQDTTSDDSELSQDSCKRPRLETGTQIARMMRRSNDPEEFRANLTATQLNLLQTHTDRTQTLLQQRISARVAALPRPALPLVKATVADCTKDGCTTATLSIWRPSEAIMEILQEGAWIEMMNVMPTGVRQNELQISAGRQSTFNKVKVKETDKMKEYLATLSRKCIDIKTLAQNPALKTYRNEIDTVGLVVLIDPPTSEFDSESNKNQHFQNVYLADTDKNMICVNFWGGVKKFGFENVLDTGQIIAGINLQNRLGNTKKNIPQYRATEFSYFTKTPKYNDARMMIDELTKKMNGIDRRKFCGDCIELKNNFSVIKNQNNTENVSPYRFNNDHNLTKNKVFIDSPLAQKPKDVSDLDLTGLDFESSFKQRDTQDMSPEELKRKKIVKDKIARLKMYGEPPPLSHMHIIHKSANATKAFKSPLLANNHCAQILPGESPKSTLQAKVTSITNRNLPIDLASSNDAALNSDQNVNNLSSPIMALNTTYVKRIGGNPVKLNFSNSNILEKSVDHFAEEFDGSPPLSLD
ncbi:breast cancer type 2 susceptibility protein homolog [Plutella xylostella]|uniref:breast cancer type 2 susceptibility protein homolog n=1 Tax=Plutella xylostella TaxID=51655 RepID=UPI002032EE98|nr:breast cancer type 2 susceptibility protein homolog [Plutella xylostella]